MLVETAELDGTDNARDHAELRRDLRDMSSPGLVIVSDDHRVTAGKMPIELGQPLSGSHWVGGGSHRPAPHHVVDVFLALEDVNPPGRTIRAGLGGYEIGQPIGYQANTPHRAFALLPAALAVRWVLRERFFGAPAVHLEQQCVLFIVIIIGLDDVLLLALAFRGGRSVRLRSNFDPEIVAHPFLRPAVAELALNVQHLPWAAADLGFVVVPLTSLRSGNLYRDTAVSTEPQLAPRRQRLVRFPKQPLGDLSDA